MEQIAALLPPEYHGAYAGPAAQAARLPDAEPMADLKPSADARA
jgi:hypothetical protein